MTKHPVNLRSFPCIALRILNLDRVEEGKEKKVAPMKVCFSFIVTTV